MGYSIGIGLTNDCNLNCAHCYRDTNRIDNLTLDQVRQVCEAIPVDSVGMGTGENTLNPQFNEIVAYLHDRGVHLSVASNGCTLTSIPDETLQAFSDVEVSIDFPTEAEQDAFRSPGNWTLVQSAIDRCFCQGVEVSILMTLMSANFNRMAEMVDLARRSGLNLRVNAYQPVKSGEFNLSYEQFWEGYRQLLLNGRVVSCTEPVVRAAMGLEPSPSPCGRSSIRINPRGQVIPCVYWPTEGKSLPTIDDLSRLGDDIFGSPEFQQIQADPPAAQDCLCAGGCASRRALTGNLDAHDIYCPRPRGDVIQLEWSSAPSHGLVRSGNVCTTVVV